VRCQRRQRSAAARS